MRDHAVSWRQARAHPGGPIETQQWDEEYDVVVVGSAVLGPRDVEKQEAFVTEAPGLVAQLEEDPAILFTHQVFPDDYDRPGRVRAAVRSSRPTSSSVSWADFGGGEDEFGTICSDPALAWVDKVPYYAAKLVLSDVGTKGGLVIDAAGRLLQGDGAPIVGLYAAGDTSASFTAAFYPGPGKPIGTATVFGSLAAKDITG